MPPLTKVGTRRSGKAFRRKMFRVDRLSLEVLYLVVSQPRNSSCSCCGLDKREIAMARLIPKDIFYFKRD